MSITGLKQIAKNIRINIITMTSIAGSGHLAGPMGIADIFAYLYFEEFEKYKPNKIVDIPFILSCGHYAPVLYSTLIEKNIINRNEVYNLRKFGSILQGHTKRNIQYGIYNTSGSLGQGMGIACGMAYSLKASTNPERVYALISDGETNEGSIWESALFANKYNLDNLVVILDRNNIQQSGSSNKQMPLEPLQDKWLAFGFDVITTNGNNFEDIFKCFDSIDYNNGKPKLIIAYTIPGKGIKMIENNFQWHSKQLELSKLNLYINEIKNAT